jgi:hypothetical protein
VAALDRLREKLAYLKFWQGIMVVTDISLVGWIVSTADRHIDRLIDQTGKL